MIQMTVYVKPDENNYAFLRYVRWTIARHPAWENEPLADVDLVHVLMNPSEDRRVMQVSGRLPSRAMKLMQKVPAPQNGKSRVKVIDDQRWFGKELSIY